MLHLTFDFLIREMKINKVRNSLVGKKCLRNVQKYFIDVYSIWNNSLDNCGTFNTSHFQNVKIIWNNIFLMPYSKILQLVTDWVSDWVTGQLTWQTESIAKVAIRN